MNILDCVTYFDEETILEIRLNVLYKYVTKFIITEGAYDHRGNRRKLNFNLEKYYKFKDKIIYFRNQNIIPYFSTKRVKYRVFTNMNNLFFLL